MDVYLACKFYKKKKKKKKTRASLKSNFGGKKYPQHTEKYHLAKLIFISFSAFLKKLKHYLNHIFSFFRCTKDLLKGVRNSSIQADYLLWLHRLHSITITKTCIISSLINRRRSQTG